MTLPCNIISYIPSTSGIFQAHFIRISSSGKDEKYGLEIWKESSLLRRINLPSKPCVAQGNMDTTWFGGSCWSSSPDEEYLVYGAEPASSFNGFGNRKVFEGKQHYIEHFR